MNKSLLFSVTLLLAAGFPTMAAEKFDFSKLDLSKLPPASKKSALTYTNDIRSMLESSCFRCHGEQRPKGGLRLDSLEALLKGGEDGKVIVAGNSQKSPLVVAVAQIDVDRAKLHQAEAQVAQNQASLKSLEEQLSYTTLTAPIDGEVLSRDVEVGNAVSSILVLGSTATLVMTIGDTRQVYVNGKVDEADIASVYLGQPARIRIESFKNKTFAGRVTRIAPLGVEKDNVTTFEVRVSIDNPNHEIKANMTANAEILNQEHKNALSVPEQALVYDSQQNAFVDVPDSHGKNGLRRVALKAGIANAKSQGKKAVMMRIQTADGARFVAVPFPKA